MLEYDISNMADSLFKDAINGSGWHEIFILWNQNSSHLMTGPKGNGEFSFPEILNILPGFVRVLENLESPGILLWHFPGLESPGKRPLVLESFGNLLSSTKKSEVYGRQ